MPPAVEGVVRPRGEAIAGRERAQIVERIPQRHHVGVFGVDIEEVGFVRANCPVAG